MLMSRNSVSIWALTNLAIRYKWVRPCAIVKEMLKKKKPSQILLLTYEGKAYLK